jgi:16S rRNA (cytidine1402-2'-O)-methyltransferase
MTDDAAPPLAPGLYCVATPIGNLEDITLRALRVLKSVDLIACEDTRQTQKLLNHYGISTRTVSYHEHNEAERAAELGGQLAEGARIALVSDAGMPAISDPGYRIVVEAVRRGVAVIPIPGPAAFVAALAASGLPTDEFSFRGFLPAKSGARRTELEKLLAAEYTAVFYEAPHRIVEALEDAAEILGATRPVCVARELTKIHEEFLRGAAAEVLETLRRRGDVKGEIVLLIGKSETPASKARVATNTAALRGRLEQLMTEQKIDEKAALKLLAKERGVGKSELYRELQRAKK